MRFRLSRSTADQGKNPPVSGSRYPREVLGTNVQKVEDVTGGLVICRLSIKQSLFVLQPARAHAIQLDGSGIARLDSHVRQLFRLAILAV